MNKDRISFLFQRYLDDTALPEELLELERVIANPGHLEILNEIIDSTYHKIPEAFIIDKSGSAAKEKSFEYIVSQPQGQKINRLWLRLAAAASIILCLGTGTYFYFHESSIAPQTAQTQRPDIAPGGNKAYLTLANGKRIALNNAKNGLLAKQTGIIITKTADGRVVYSVEHSNHISPINDEYNFIETPKGGQFEVSLPDGTLVWLNAASSLKYPASFAAFKERKVELRGEAYFEVAKDKSHPFIVTTDKQDVQVLGTHFDINAYTDEPSTKTTLLEGRVQVSAKTGGHVEIKPGEQAVSAGTGSISVAETDVSEAVAWKNGKFVFDNESIESIMRKLSRWYDIKVVFQGDVKDKAFAGSISRYDNISKILDKITLTKAVHFKIEGKEVTVMR